MRMKWKCHVTWEKKEDQDQSKVLLFNNFFHTNLLLFLNRTVIIFNARGLKPGQFDIDMLFLFLAFGHVTPAAKGLLHQHWKPGHIYQFEIKSKHFKSKTRYVHVEEKRRTLQ